MKRTLYFFILLLIVLHLNSSAQIIRFNFTTTNVACNNTGLGSIKVQVTSGNAPFTYAWSTGATTTKIDNLNTGDYTLTITDSDGNDTSATVNIAIDECHMGPSRIFTPNSDDINDTWIISNYQYFSNALIVVYNRLGQKVFECKGLYEKEKIWDGNDILGIPLPDASYYFVILEDKDVKSNVIKGDVTILR
jgi:gliding motility-associated-like protein